MKKVVIFVLLFLMILPIKSIGGDFSDMPNNWSTQALEKAVENGLLTGANGMIMPNENLTRGQMATVINRSFGAYKEGSLEDFTDVSPDKWYYSEMAKAVNMKTFKGNNGKLNPSNTITREEAFTVMARALKIEPIMEEPTGFLDLDQISTWAKGEIYAMIQAGYIEGSNNMVNPKGLITRAEFAKLMDNIIKTYISKDGEYTSLEKGNVMINTKDVVLKNLVVEGDLIIGEGLADGNVTLLNVDVLGRMVVRGGGVDSIQITGTSNIKNLIISRIDGKVRVYAKEGVKIEDTSIIDGEDVILEGEFERVTLLSPDIILNLKSSRISSLIISGLGSKLDVDKDSSVDKVIANANNIIIQGKGIVKEVTANANDILVNTKDTKVTAGENTTGVMAGDIKVKAGESESVKEAIEGPAAGPGGSPIVEDKDLIKSAYLKIGNSKPERANIKGSDIDIKLPPTNPQDNAKDYLIEANFNKPVKKVSVKLMQGNQKVDVGNYFGDVSVNDDKTISAGLDKDLVDSYYSIYGENSKVTLEVIVRVLEDSKEETFIINIFK